MKNQGSTLVKSKSAKLYFGIFILSTVALGSVLASNVFITDPSKKTEFGQGEYQITACDTWVQMNIDTGETGSNGAPAGYSPLTGIQVAGLDTHQCANTSFKITNLDINGQEAPLFRIDNEGSLCSEITCSLGSNAQSYFDVKINSNSEVSLGSSSSATDLRFDQETGIYTILFSHPAILANEVHRLTIQSQKLSA